MTEFCELLYLKNWSVHPILEFTKKIKLGMAEMVCIKKQKFEQMLLLLVNLITQKMNNLAKIDITVGFSDNTLV